MEWIYSSLPYELQKDTTTSSMFGLDTPPMGEKLPLYNILAGLCWSISLKYAGTGDVKAIKLLLRFYRVTTASLLDRAGDQKSEKASNYDQRLAKSALLRFQNLLALSAATVAAGTGNLEILRQLRAAHANVTAASTFGSHQAVHTAIGALFLGHGRYTFGTSNLAIASLLCAFYPIFPKDAMDNAAHLQAFRHFWTFAAEPRCLIARDVETKKAIITPVLVVMKNGSLLEINAPKLLPEIEQISRLVTTSTEYWPLVLDFEHNPEHVRVFKEHQTIWLTRKSCLLYTSPSPRDGLLSRMPSSA